MAKVAVNKLFEKKQIVLDINGANLRVAFNMMPIYKNFAQRAHIEMFIYTERLSFMDVIWKDVTYGRHPVIYGNYPGIYGSYPGIHEK